MTTKKSKKAAAPAAVPAISSNAALAKAKAVPLRIWDRLQLHVTEGVWRPALVQDVDALGIPTLRLYCTSDDPTLPACPRPGVLIRRVTPYPGEGGSHGAACDYEIKGASKGLDLYCWRRV